MGLFCTMEIQQLYKIFQKHSSVSTDTRKIEPGGIFFALKGENYNGNKFAEKALVAGASYSIIDDPGLKDSNDRFIFVPDCLTALQQLAKYHRNKLKIKIIGITGTNGKTTTKELVYAVLASAFSVQATRGNFNNHIGVPLTLLELKESTEIAIIEMGANHPGEIADLCELSSPDYGIITNIGKAHLEGFGDSETIIETKRALYEAVRKKNGTLIVNNDNELLLELSKGIARFTFGRISKGDINGQIVANNPFLELSFEFDGSKKVKTRLIGSYNFENVMAAVCCGIFFKTPTSKIVQSLENYTPSNNRSQVMKTAANLLILDAYNANPTSLEKAILNFIDLNYTDKVLIIGDMLELGKAEDLEHSAILETLSEIQDVEIILIGPVFHRLYRQLSFKTFENVEVAKQYLINYPMKNKTILLKGSRGIHLELLNEVL